MTGFAAMTEDMDAGIGRILDTIEAADLVANTYIIFMSDNGGRADFPGREGEGVPSPNLPLRAGKGTMYEGGVRVPFIIEDNLLELFDLSKDLEEKCNLVQKMPDKAMELDAKLVAYIEEVGATCEREEVKPQRRKPKKSDE